MFKPALLTVTLATPALAEEVYTLTNGQTVTPLEQFQECDVCPEMIVMPLGSFMMGAVPGESDNPFKIFRPEGEGGRFEEGEVRMIPHEHPRHEVEIDIPFAMGRNEVTIGEWMRCVEAAACSAMPAMEAPIITPGEFQVEWEVFGPAHPATDISMLDMLEYVDWLNAQVGADVYRLPTEAEWEYSARAGSETRFAQGESLTTDQANFNGRVTARMLEVEQRGLLFRQMPLPVQELDSENDWGLRHMAGNVAEITMSPYFEEHLGLSTSSEYLAIAPTVESDLVAAKGGHYDNAMDSARIASRLRTERDWTFEVFGFRILRQME